MKKIYLALLTILLTSLPSFAEGYGYKYIDNGYIYTKATMPCSVGKVQNNLNQSGIVDISNKKVDLSNLKKGISSKSNILGIVELGDGGIMAAARNGNIEKIHYVETKKTKVFIPLGFIPIYVDTLETSVYGE